MAYVDLRTMQHRSIEADRMLIIMFVIGFDYIWTLRLARMLEIKIGGVCEELCKHMFRLLGRSWISMQG